ncbi:host attachment family protein [Pseudoalteromonas sp. MM17-2]|uniref:host attachment family protein n=1 Tax=Pseudoalteromonas TaxID=53246 RepID=UPI00034A2D89|nr:MULTISPECIES: host attachment family protein [Pseudoalteromonas]MCG7543176.1 host attachment family protein [Pseudoalteromonas sp. MM17-2]RZF79838.1 host attachment protein [Pseudoalteromonas sp. CO325X]TMO44415.1 host attachment protein [Pseudoalteromonas ruthenica]TMO49625.1 host attachment protein [Pseudoalteromonas ruthenica]
MIGRSYVVVANHSEAQIFALRNHSTELELQAHWSNPFARSDEQDIYTDRAGRQSAPAKQVQGVDAMSRKDAVDIEAQRFAADIAKWLDDKRKNDKVYRIELIAESGFLGKLRGEFNKHTTELIDKTLAKDVIGANEGQILDYLKKVH